MSENGKLQGSDVDVTVSNPFFAWLDNFWYHHKWKVIIISFFLIVAVVGIVQMLNKEKYDVDVTVATHMTYSADKMNSLEGALSGVLREDLNGDGKRNARITFYKIYSEQELTDANEAETDAEGNPIIYADESYNKDQINQFNAYIMTGECTVMILSEYVYSNLVDRRAEDILLKPMSEIFGDELPEGTMSDGYGIRLSKTGAYEYLDAFSQIPDDAVLCIMRPFAFSKGGSAERHENAVEYFISLVEFGR